MNPVPRLIVQVVRWWCLFLAEVDVLFKFHSKFVNVLSANAPECGQAIDHSFRDSGRQLWICLRKNDFNEVTQRNKWFGA